MTFLSKRFTRFLPRRHVHAFTAAVTLALASCRMVPPPAPPPPAVTLDIDAARWAVTWQGDAESVTAEPQTNGALKLTITGNPASVKGTILTARTPGWSLSPDSSVRIVASAPDGDLDLALALRTDRYYETPARRVPRGATGKLVSNLVFDLASADFKSDRTDWAFRDRVDLAPPLETLELVVYPVAGEMRTLLIHGVQLSDATGPAPRAPRRMQTMAIRNVRAPDADVPRFGKLEITAELATAYTNPFDPREIAVDGVFTSPSGVERVCPGFFSAWPAVEGAPDEWKVRFSPSEEGEWTWRLRARTPAKTLVSRPGTFRCTAAQGSGPVRVSRRHPSFFEHADGTFFYPIGHNVCWNRIEEYEEQFARMRGAGENWSRIWIAPWNCEIEWSPRGGEYEGLGRYNLDKAAKLDRIVELAEANGLYLQLVLHEHCRLSAKTNPEWPNNPYNKEWGGPCAKPQDFFTSADARRLAQNRLRYIVARWGWSSHILAWELFNEVDLTDDFRFDTDTAWHREMAEYIRSIDPHRRLITTSYISQPNPGTYALPLIEFCQSHIYSRALVESFAGLYEPFRTFRKPHFIGEFGRDTRDGVDMQDKEGRVLHAGIWAQFMIPSGGNAMSWWWYDLIHPNDLYHHWSALTRFAAGVDRREPGFAFQPGKLGSANVMALVSPTLVLVWAYDPAVLPWSETSLSASEGIRGELNLTGLAQGMWVIEQWDTWKGVKSAGAERSVTDGTLAFPVDVNQPDVAFKIRYAGAGRPKDLPKLDLEAWDPRGASAPGDRTRIAVPRAKKAVTIDGEADEWEGVEEIRVEPGEGRSPDDNRLAFSVAHDGDNLYVLVRVTDDHVVRREKVGGSLWKDDNVEIWVDSLNDAGFFSNLPNNPGCFQFNIAPAPEGTGPADHVTYRNPKWNDVPFPGVRAASQVTPGGYVVEALIPLKALRGGRPGGNEIGFNVSACDADPGEEWEHLLWQGLNEWDGREWSVGELK